MAASLAIAIGAALIALWTMASSLDGCGLSSAFGDVAGDVPLNYTGKLLVALGASVTGPSRMHVRGRAESVLEPITERELEVLKLLDSKVSNREIAARMFVSLATVKTHIKHLYRKLGVRARHQAIVRGKEFGLL
jgi:LuxR family transcriptional regulator, maltose regulon positive regulatory protein